jgi:hypothetical protein
MNIGLTPGNELPIGPNKAIAVGHRHFLYLFKYLLDWVKQFSKTRGARPMVCPKA